MRDPRSNHMRMREALLLPSGVGHSPIAQNHQTSSSESQHLAAIAPRAPHSPQLDHASPAATNHSRPPKPAAEPRTETCCAAPAAAPPRPQHRQKKTLREAAKNPGNSNQFLPRERAADLSWNRRAGEGDFANNLTGAAACYLAAADPAGREAPIHRRRPASL